MKYIGNSSPCWTIKKEEETITRKGMNILKENREFQEIVGPGKYENIELPKIKSKPSIYSFEKSIKFSNEKYLNKMKNSYKNILNKEAKNIEAKFSKRNPRKISNQHGMKENGFTLSKRTNILKAQPDVPPPGSYELAMEGNKNYMPKYSFSYKAEDSVMLNNATSPELGPGTYWNEKSTFSKGIKFCTSDRGLEPLNEIKISVNKASTLTNSKETPEISLPKVKKSHSTFSKAARIADLNLVSSNLKVPGPGQYVLPDYFNLPIGQWKGRSYSIGGKLQSIDSNQRTPGPQTYVILNNAHEKPKGHTFAKADKDLFEATKRETSSKNDNKSEDYQNEELFIEQSRPQVKYRGGDIGKAPRLYEFKSSTPGPNSYEPEINLTRKQAPQVSIGSKSVVKKYKKFIDFQQRNPVPIDINYDSVEKGSKARKFQKAPRSPEEKFNQFKNGTKRYYDVRQKIGNRGFKFGSEPKVAYKKENISELGPGFYDIKQTLPQIQPWIKIKHKYEAIIQNIKN